MRRGELWTVAGGIYANKPRPAVVLQADFFAGLNSVTVAPCTTDVTDVPLFRIELMPGPQNGLQVPCRIMIDKITTVPHRNLGTRIGEIGEEDLARVNKAAAVFVGIA